jgi:hypothetical protein
LWKLWGLFFKGFRTGLELSWEFGGNLMVLSEPDNQHVKSFFGNLVGIWWEFERGNRVGKRGR